MREALILIAALLVAQPCFAGEVAYRPGGASFAGTWHAFYDLGDHEPELDDPLIKRGPAMVPAICEAVTHSDMKYRRYALSALGYIRDPEALPCLERILRDEEELDYFRGDALEAMYRINQQLGERYVVEFGGRGGYLLLIADLISRGAVRIGESGLGDD